MITTQKGFSVVEVLIVVVIIGVIGAVGWLIYGRQTVETTDNQTVKTQTGKLEEKQESPPAVTEEENVPVGWKKYDANSLFGFIYPNEWESVTKVSEFPLSQVFKLHYVGEVKLNKNLDGWIHATTASGAQVGSKASVIQEESNSSIKVWRFGFGDAGYASLIPTFVTSNGIYQITTGRACPEKTADCMSLDEYQQAYNTLVGSIKLK